MKIKRLLQDPSGTFVTFADGTRYDFKPDSPLGAFVAEVENEAHVDRFLSLPYAYAEVPEVKAHRDPLTDGTAPTEQTDGTAPKTFGEMTDDELRAIYPQIVGKPPHHAAGREKLIEQITAAQGAR